MRTRDVGIREIAAGKNWRLKEPTPQGMLDWEIEDCSNFKLNDNVAYSGVLIFRTGEIRPILLIKQVGDPEWWGDTLEYVDGYWRELRQTNHVSTDQYIADPLPYDPSFIGHYSHENQRTGFAKYRDRLRAGALAPMMPN